MVWGVTERWLQRVTWLRNEVKRMTIGEVKENLLKKVRYRGSEYMLMEYIYWADIKERKARHSVKLLDMTTMRCETRVPLEDVEVINND